MLSIVPIVIYLTAWALLIHSVITKQLMSKNFLLSLVSIGWLFHVTLALLEFANAHTFNLGFYSVSSLFFVVIVALLTVSALKKPLHNLFLLLLPLSALSVLVSGLFDSHAIVVKKYVWGLGHPHPFISAGPIAC